VHTGVKSAALVAAVFIDFPENKCANLCRDPAHHWAAPYEELFFWGTRHHCPVEVVGAYVWYPAFVCRSFCLPAGLHNQLHADLAEIFTER